MAGLSLSPRSQQLKLVELARDATKNGDQRFVQAGTGTGKSYALLSVALEVARESGLPSVVVCPNNALIDQYVVKDVPSVRGVAGGKFVHIKGRNRYVCASSVATFTMHNSDDRYLGLISGGELEWAKLGVDKDWGCPGSDLCTPVKLHLESCAARTCECPFSCGSVEARKKAVDADVIITNAHVLVWDRLIRVFTDDQVGLLPEFGALFIDECHELEAIGRGCLGVEISETSSIVGRIEGLADWVATCRKHLVEEGKSEGPLSRSLAVQEMVKKAKISAGVLRTREELSRTETRLLKQYEKFIEFVQESDRFVSVIDVSDPDKARLRRVCIDAGPTFNQILTGQPSVLVSGTIPSSDRRRLGLPRGVRTVSVGHPFDYGKSSLVVSRFNAKEKSDAPGRVASAARAINQTGGGTLMLFTSWADLESVVPAVVKQLKPGIDVYVQSREDPTTLAQDIEDFKRDGNAVLAGVRSLFTGVDIPGPALRQVILWKVPWPVPTIEVKAIVGRFGHNTYVDMMLTILTQGIGRLIRTAEDSGRVLILDSRAKDLDFASNGMTHHLLEWKTR